MNLDKLPAFDSAELLRAQATLAAAVERQRAAERAYPVGDFVWWQERPPSAAWHEHGVLVAVNAGTLGGMLNGYAWLTPDHPWRSTDPDLFVGPEGIGPAWDDLDIHGGITFGPHVTGWIGFDTGHFRDVWTRDALRALVDDHLATEDDFAEWMRHRDLLRGIGGGLADLTPDPILWTGAAVVAETKRLAEQVAAAAAT